MLISIKKKNQILRILIVKKCLIKFLRKGEINDKTISDENEAK